MVLRPLTEQEIIFCKLQSRKEIEHLTQSQIAIETGISRATAYNWLDREDIKAEINKQCTASLKEALPLLSQKTLTLLNSNRASDIKTGVDLYNTLEKRELLANQQNTTTIECAKMVEAVKFFIESTYNMAVWDLKDEEQRKEVIKLLANYIVTEAKNRIDFPSVAVDEFIEAIDNGIY